MLMVVFQQLAVRGSSTMRLLLGYNLHKNTAKIIVVFNNVEKV